MPDKIAVVGASGFIGRHVLNALLSTDADIVATTRTPSKLAGLPDRIRVLELDAAKQNEGVFDYLGRPDVVLHLAWDGLPNYKSQHHFENELPQNYKFLKKLIEEGLTDLVVSGTCFEYGMQEGALSEQMACQPANPYALAKHTLHRRLLSLQQERLFNLTWARLFYMYGEGQGEKSLWSQFNAALANGESQFNMSGGEQLRDFLPISEVAALLVALSKKRLNLGTVNLCSGYPQSVRSLIESWMVERKRTIALNLGHYPYPDYEPMAFWGTDDKLRTILGTR